MKSLKLKFVSFICMLLVFFLRPVFDSIQNGLNDALMRHKISNRLDSPIKIVYLDNDDISALGGWPIPRNIYAFLADQLLVQGAKAVAFDVFWEPQPGNLNENDLLLYHTLNKFDNIFGSYFFQTLGEKEISPIEMALLSWDEAIKSESAMPAAGLRLPEPKFLEGKARFGFTNLPVSSDGYIRKAILLANYGSKTYASLTRRLAQVVNPNLDVNLANFIINYRIDSRHLPLFSVKDILTENKNSGLQGSIVLIGVIAPQLGFSSPTPVDPRMPIIGIHAQILDNLLNQSYLRPLNSLAWLALLFCCWWILNLPIYKRPWQIWGLPLLFMVLFTLLGYFLWDAHILFPFYAGWLGIVLLRTPDWLKLYRQKQETLAYETQTRQHLEQRLVNLVGKISQLEQENAHVRRQYQSQVIKLRRELTQIKLPIPAKVLSDFPEIICSDASPMIKILTEIQHIAATDASILIVGESGTGKELIARAIHRFSRRSQHKFVAVNCGALAENLLESELFGHEKGAFTGAIKEKIGFFDLADKGTIFLDEIGDTSLAFQTRLLRFLQEGQFYRVGSTKLRVVSVRVLAASNRPLEQLISLNKFRQDLYFRLNVLSIRIPPLRERGADIPVLLAHFLKDCPVRISDAALQVLLNYPWPGNVRELENFAMRMRLLGGDRLISAEWVQQQLSMDKSTPQDTFDARVLELFRQLKFSHNANTLIAHQLGNMHRSTITEYLKGLGFLYFYESDFVLDQAIRRFNPTPDPELDARLRNRISKYLKNLGANLDVNLTFEENLGNAKLLFRKLPQKYYPAALAVTTAYLQGRWRI